MPKGSAQLCCRRPQAEVRKTISFTRLVRLTVTHLGPRETPFRATAILSVYIDGALGNCKSAELEASPDSG